MLPQVDKPLSFQKLPQKALLKYHARFGRYVRSFLKRSPQDAPAVSLKIVHSQKVRREIADIARASGLCRRDVILAEITGLFHDIGRFEQFLQFHTFNDAQSVDHALLGRQVLEKEELLKDFSAKDRDIILDAVFFHNKLVLPAYFKGRKLTICRLIRDADKLDILRVFDEIYKKGSGCKAADLGLPESHEVSESVYKSIMQERVVQFKHVQSDLDFLVMRLSWLYDITFPRTLEKIRERGYVENMAQRIPEGRCKKEILDKIRGYLEERLCG